MAAVGPTIVIGLSLLAFPARLSAQGSPFLVRDINPTLSVAESSSYPENFAALGSIALFEADDELHGRELWRSDGTPEGTQFVKDIRPGREGSGLNFQVVFGELLYFAADDGCHGWELWRTDGTSEGTILLKDVYPGLPSSYPYKPRESPTPFAAPLDNRLVFTANDGIHGYELWITDGTPEGTSLFEDVLPGPSGSSPKYLVPFNGRLLFTALDTYPSSREIWITGDGQGPSARVSEKAAFWGDGPAPYSVPWTIVGNWFLFIGYGDADELGLWRTDGTDAGTVFLKDMDIGNWTFSSYNFVTHGSKALAIVNTAADASGLWLTDGTTTGTQLLQAFDVASVSRPVAFKSGVAFVAVRADGTGQLWKSDGTPEGTVVFKEFPPVPYYTNHGFSVLTPVGEEMFFAVADSAHGQELWRTDGTEEGTVLVKDIRSGSLGSYIRYLTNIDGTLFFTSNDGIHGNEIWKTDGTEAGTVLIKDIRPPSKGAFDPSRVLPAADMGGRLFFAADDGALGAELWVSDGTSRGTRLVEDLFTGYGSSTPGHFVPLGNRLLFTAHSGYTGRELWRSDGTPAGTYLVKDIRPGYDDAIEIYSLFSGLAAYGDSVYFAANDGMHGREIWKSDGTEEGTSLLLDIEPGANSSSPLSYTQFGGCLLFSARTEAGGGALWKTDGTATGTLMVSDTKGSSNTYGGAPEDLTVHDGTLFFCALNPSLGDMLWRSDGTATGTLPIAKVPRRSDGWGYPAVYSKPEEHLMAGNGRGVVYVAYQKGPGTEIFASDGTPEGTRMLKDIAPETTSGVSSDPLDGPHLTHAGALTYFIANDVVHGMELWKTDGTTSGTEMVRDIVPGPDGSVPTDLTVWKGQLYFTAFQPETGCEPWTSDGTEAGTRRIADLNPGPEHSNPYAFTGSGDYLYFVADDGSGIGYELWALGPMTGANDNGRLFLVR